MNVTKILFFFMISIFLVLAAFAADEPNYAGTWIGTAELPDQTIDSVTVTLKKAKAGLEGTVGDELGVIAPETLLTLVALDGEDMKIEFPTVDGVMITLLLKTGGDKLIGQWSDEQGESGKVELARKK